jgi:histidine ammonia-lyase
LLEGIERLINYRVLPCIPSEGSVGASGDLTPLSYVAAALIGEREVIFRGALRPAAEVLAELGLVPLTLAPKEGLAIMNGTAVMTALACLAWDRAQYLSRLAARISALAALAMRGNREHFHPALFEVKPHAGQAEAAGWIYADMAVPQREAGARVQDRYSIRCAPHVIGVLRDALTWLRRDIENELNSANDNPIVDPERRLILHGGHFYGGHIAFAMDSLKAAVASVADLMDRQMALLVDAKFNHGLPQNLSGAAPERASINHGFKGVQISVSAWTAEALKLTMPAASFSRSTESHNQDKVSMGTIAARDCLRVLELTEQVAAAMVLATHQALVLRRRSGELEPATLSAGVREFVEKVSPCFDFLEEDRRLDHTLQRTVDAIREREWCLYPQEGGV